MTAVSTTQLELIKAEPIPLADFTAVQTKSHGVRQAIYRYSDTQQARRHWESEPQLRQTNDQPEQPWVVLRMPSPNDGARGLTATFEGHGNTRSHPS